MSNEKNTKMVRTYATKIRRPQNEIGKISFNNHVGTIKIGGNYPRF